MKAVLIEIDRGVLPPMWYSTYAALAAPRPGSGCGGMGDA